MNSVPECKFGGSSRTLARPDQFVTSTLHRVRRTIHQGMWVRFRGVTW